MDRFTDDILSDILIRLPAKQIGQMRCVSKPWNSLLSKPSFTKSHLDRSILHSTDLFLFIYESWVSGEFVCSLRSTKYPDLELRSFIPPVASPCILQIIGSINGLICMYGDPNMIHVWNPSLSASRILPSPIISQNSRCNCVALGFGFDSYSEDYKVVKFMNVNFVFYDLESIGNSESSEDSESVTKVTEWLQVEVFSLREDCWRLIPSRVPSQIENIEATEAQFVDGRLYWLGYYSDDSVIILWFDLVTESFGEMSVPDAARVDSSTRFGELDGRLFLYHCRMDEHFEIWAMDHGSWVKHLVLGSPVAKMRISSLKILWNGEFLLVTEDETLCFFDSKSGELRKSEIGDRGNCIDIALYVDSLVWFPAVTFRSIEPDANQGPS